METYEQYRTRIGIGAVKPEEVEALEKQVIIHLIADEPDIFKRLNELEDSLKLLIKLLSGVYKTLEGFNERLQWAEEQVDGMENFLSNTLKEMSNNKKTNKYKYK